MRLLRPPLSYLENLKIAYLTIVEAFSQSQRLWFRLVGTCTIQFIAVASV